MNELFKELDKNIIFDNIIYEPLQNMNTHKDKYYISVNGNILKLSIDLNDDLNDDCLRYKLFNDKKLKFSKPFIYALHFKPMDNINLDLKKWVLKYHNIENSKYDLNNIYWEFKNTQTKLQNKKTTTEIQIEKQLRKEREIELKKVFLS